MVIRARRCTTFRGNILLSRAGLDFPFRWAMDEGKKFRLNRSFSAEKLFHSRAPVKNNQF